VVQGGPGCSSLLGLTYENGPFRLHNSDGTTHMNPHAWTKHANMLYIDNPVGAGFSYVEDSDDYIVDETTMADELYTAVATIMEKFPTWGKSKLIVAGESYGGKYVPSVATKIHEMNAKKASPQINLYGLAMGDGMSDPENQIKYYAEYAFFTGLVGRTERDRIQKKQDNIGALISKEDFQSAWGEWNSLVNGVLRKAGGISSFDWRQYHSFSTHPANTFFNLNATKTKLRVGEREYMACNKAAYNHLEADMMKSVRKLFGPLVENYPVLLYNGQFDFVIPVPAAEDWISKIKWSGQDTFATADRSVWKPGSKPLAYFKRYKNLAHAVMIGAGHMVPMQRPRTTRRLIMSFIQGKLFD